MKNKLPNRIVSVFLSLCLILGLITTATPLGVMPVLNADDVAEYDMSSGNVVISEAGDYVVSGSSASNTITVNPGITGDVNLTLNGVNIDVSSTPNKAALSLGANSTVNLTLDGNNYLYSGTCCAGVQVPQNATLVITDQSTGTLDAYGGHLGAGIGSGSGGDCGNITINGGSITATGNHGAGIGGGNGGDGGTITIHGGTVTANGGNFGAGIGGGSDGDGGSINIHGGTVTSNGDDGGAGIGGGSGGDGGSINIHGGTVTSNGADGGAGIGGGSDGDGGTITINGGNVTTTGGSGGMGGGGAGIGGGSDGNGGTIIINAGTVTAIGGSGSMVFGGGAGIGGSYIGSGGTITITGGAVTAIGGDYSAGIGGGYIGSGGTITIIGGAVTATGGSGANDLGAGEDGSFNFITIDGGSVKSDTVNPSPTNGANPVFKTEVTLSGVITETPVTYSVDSGATISTVTDNDGKLYLWLPADERSLAVTANSKTYITSVTVADSNDNVATATPVSVITAENVTVTGADGTFQTGDTVTVTWNNSSSGDNNENITAVTVDFSAFGGASAEAAEETEEASNIWTATYTIQSGTLVADNCSVAVTATNGSGNQSTYRTPGYAVNNTMLNISQGDITITAAGTYSVIGSTNSKTITVAPNISGDVNLTLNEVTINVPATNNKAALSVGANSTLNLTLTGNNTLRSGNFCAGVQVPQNATLVITQQSLGTLNAYGGSGGAGIGGGLDRNGGTISIAGGTITATGNDGAGIGGGWGGSGGTITINGGTVTATGTYSAGIGGGDGGSGGSITINGGTVTANGGTNGAGIGGGDGGSGDSITIHDGTVTANSGTNGAGIGGGYGGSGGTITIHGGTVTANGKNTGAGIGGGQGGSGGTITIHGGTITAKSGNYAAGIGGGDRGDGGTIAINGGSVTANGNYGAGIGGGDGGSGGTITIHSGTVTATSNNGAGIGGGWYGSGGTTTITGGSIQANSVNPQPTDGTNPVYLTTVTVPGILSATPVTYTVDGGETISTFTHPDGKQYLWLFAGERTLTVTANSNTYGAITTIAANNTNAISVAPIPVITAGHVTVTGASGADGTFQTDDTVTVRWDNSSSGDHNESITAVAVDFSAFGGGSAVAAEEASDLWTATYRIQSGTLIADDCSVAITATNGSGYQTTYHTPGYAVNNTAQSISDGNITITAAGDYIVVGSTNSNTITVNPGITGDVNLMLNGVTIDVSSISNKAALSVGANSTVNLTLIGNTTLRSGSSCAGVQVPQGAALVITQQSTGSLVANGGTYGAGIGGTSDGSNVANDDSGGTITIHGGTVTANGGTGAAGIGGGYSDSGGSISIHGGTVTANGGAYAAGIGGGSYYGDGGTINIHGGNVTATGDNGGAGIGGGAAGIGGTITIHGGNVTATGTNGASGIGGGRFGSGGSISIHGGTITATANDNGAGIGNGNYGSGGSLIITGGTVTAAALDFTSNALGAAANGPFGSITITGGSVKANTISPAPTNGTLPVYRVTVTTGTLAEQADVLYKVNFGADSSIATHPDGKLYLWLTYNLHQISVTHNSVDYSSAAEIAPNNSNALTLGLARVLTLSPFTASYTGSPIAYAGNVTVTPPLADGEQLTYTYFTTAADREAFTNPMVEPPTNAGTYYILGLLPQQDPYGSVMAYTTMTIKKATPSSPGGWGGNSRYVQDEDIYTGSGHTSVTLTGEATTLTAQQVDSLITQNATAPIIIRGAGYTVTFPTGSMRESLGGRSLNLSLVFNWASDRYTTIKPLAGTGFVMLLDFLHSGALPGTATIRVNVGTAYAGKTLYYYYYNPTYKAFEYRQAGVVDAAGFITLSQSSCSQYVLSTTALSNERPGIPETGGGAHTPTRSAPLLFCVPLTKHDDEQLDENAE